MPTTLNLTQTIPSFRTDINSPRNLTFPLNISFLSPRERIQNYQLSFQLLSTLRPTSFDPSPTSILPTFRDTTFNAQLFISESLINQYLEILHAEGAFIY